MGKYYDIYDNAYEICYRNPTDEEQKRAKEYVEKEKEFLNAPFAIDNPFKKILLNDEHKYLNCYKEFYHDIGENNEPVTSSII